MLRTSYLPLVLHIDVATQVRLVVTAHFEHANATARAELGKDVLIEVCVGRVRFAFFVFQSEIYDNNNNKNTACRHMQASGLHVVDYMNVQIFRTIEGAEPEFWSSRKPCSSS